MHGCTSLQEIEIPDTVKTIEDYAFKKTNLKEINLPDNTTQIGQHAFEECENLRKINANNVRFINYRAFYRCRNLSEVSFSNNKIKNGLISGDAFGSCDSLSTVTLPDDFSSIASNAFLDCDNLSTINFAPGDNPIPEGQPWGATNATVTKLTE